MKKVSTLLILLCCLWQGDCFGQTGLSLVTAYEVPADELKLIYMPAYNYSLGFFKTDIYKNKRTAWGASLSYANFAPKEEVFYYPANSFKSGTIRYTDYQVIQLAASGRKGFIFNRLELFVGAEMGYQYVISGYQSVDAQMPEDVDNSVARVMQAVKAGAAFLLTDHVSIFTQFRATCSFVLDLDKSEDLINFSYAPGAGVSFCF